MGIEIGRKWLVLVLVLLVSTVVCAWARPSSFLSEGATVAEPRMLRTFFLNDYGKPSANRGHDPGNRMGDHGGGRRH